MAIYHLSHKSVGRSTHAAGTAGAHADYITRSGACDQLIGEHMPIPKVRSRGGPARKWLDEQEASDRKNARVIDKLTLALPHELDAEQQVDLVRNFAASITGGKAPYLAAFHRQGKDSSNQHCHLILRDRHVETGKRVWGNEKKKPTEIMREKWEAAANTALAQAMVSEKIDRRTLKEQGIDREPQQHVGPVAQSIDKSGRPSWKLEAVRDEETQKDEQNRIEESRRRALDPVGLGSPPKVAFIRKETPRKEINQETAIFLQNARFLERLWEFSTAVKNETLRFAEDAYRASAAKIRSFVLPRPRTMDEESRFAEIGRLEMIGQFRARSENSALYAAVDIPDRLHLLKELPATERKDQALEAFANTFRKFRGAQYSDWMGAPTRQNPNMLIAALDHAMKIQTKPAALNNALPPEKGFNKAHDALDDFVPLVHLHSAWTRRQNDQDVAALNASIWQEQENQRIRQAALEAAEDRRRAAADAEWEKGRPEREAKAKAAQDAEIARERAAERLREAEEAQRAQKEADGAQRAAERLREAEERHTAAKDTPPDPINRNDGPSGP